MTGSFPPQGAKVTELGFSDLEGWQADDHATALAVFLESCAAAEGPAWNALGETGRRAGSARGFFEDHFSPVVIEDGNDSLFTGYFEPELRGDRARSDKYPVPLYRTPPELPAQKPWLTRSEIEDRRALDGRNLAVAWIGDPVDRFFLQVQGSGCIILPDGTTMRLGFAATNGHPYRSIGQELIRRGVFTPEQISAEAIKAWARQNPDPAAKLFLHNPAYVFFRELDAIAAHKGPFGAMNRSVTAHRSIAVDPVFTPLGAPVWVEIGETAPIRRLMVAQDTGSAIKGAQRADVFFGTGEAAGRAAGAMRNSGRMVVLLPHQTAREWAAADQP